MAFLDETGLAELWSLIQAEDANVEALANTKAKIATGSYTGTGTCGKNNKTSLTLDFVPKFVMVAANIMDTLENGVEVRRLDVMVLLPTVGGFSASDFSSGASITSVGSTVSGNAVSWWAKYDTYQMNVSGRTYNYVAIG